METRSYIQAPFEVKSLTDAGIVEGYGSVFGVLDDYADVIEPGAFKNTLEDRRNKNRMPSMLWQHFPSQPIGKWIEMDEDTHGLRVKGQLAMKTAKGSEAYELLKMDAINGLSIGYITKEFEMDTETQVRRLKAVDLWEVSVVTFPANDYARIDGVKASLVAGSIPTIRELERFLRDAGFSRSQAKGILADGYKAIDRKDSEREAEDAAARLLEILNQSSKEMRNVCGTYQDN